MRTPEELFSEVIQLRQMLSTAVEFKRILQMMLCEEDIAENQSVKKFNVHFQGALLKFRIYRKIFKEHLLHVDGIDDLMLSKCEEAGCSLCNYPEKSSNSSNLEKLKNENQPNDNQALLLEVEKILSTHTENQNQCQNVNTKNKLKGAKMQPKRAESTSAESSEKTMETSVDHGSKNNSQLSTSKIITEPLSEKPSSSAVPFIFHNKDCKRMLPFPLPDTNSQLMKPYIGENIITVETPEQKTKEEGTANKKLKTDISTSEKTSKTTRTNARKSPLKVSKAVPKVGYGKLNKNESSRSILAVKCHISDCQMVFDNKNLMQRHCDMVHPESFKCSQRKKMFVIKNGIFEHFNTHENSHEHI